MATTVMNIRMDSELKKSAAASATSRRTGC